MASILHARIQLPLGDHNVPAATSAIILKVALPVPLFRLFDYYPPDSVTADELQPGQRIQVNFGHRQLLGIIVAISDEASVERDKIRPALTLLDQEPVLSASILKLLNWAASYYCHPLGEVLYHALPVALRQGKPAHFPTQTLWQLTELGGSTRPSSLSGSRQQQLLEELQRVPQGLSQEALRTLEYSSQTLSSLQKRGLIHSFNREQRPHAPDGNLLNEVHLSLNAQQQNALDTLLQRDQGFSVTLLEGVTGSGKTEVYLQLIEHHLLQKQQVLVLVPEIGLTPQTLRRFKHRFNVNVVILHSGMNDNERLHAWLEAREGIAQILIGTRSALMVPLPRLGLIVIDEEHDASFKQHEGFRYHARDLAIVRAKQANVPVLLGSATPSLESLHNVERGSYYHLRMLQRAGNAEAPRLHCLDIRKRPLRQGFSAPLLQSIRRHIEQGQQVMVFLNRRGFAPTLHCSDCGWLAECASCDARMTLHKQSRRLVCHHCDYQAAIPLRCPSCGSAALEPIGQGTERSEDALSDIFPDVPVIRIDRDSVRGKQRMETLLEPVHKGHPCILLGTQMLAKGHHFPDVTLVAIIDADQGLFSADFRGMERMAQLLVQVAGRAGRAQKPGEVILQTEHADHPMLATLCEQGYDAFAREELHSRQHVGLPPWQPMALLRADHRRPAIALEWLSSIRQALQDYILQQHWGHEIQLAGPLPASMEKRHDRYRALLHLYGSQRRELHHLLQWLCAFIELNPPPRDLRWSVDVDPADTF